MNTERELDRIIEAWMEDRTGGPRPDALADALDEAYRAPQRRGLARWFPFGLAGDGSLTDREHGRRQGMLVGLSGTLAVVAIVMVGAWVALLGGDVFRDTGPVPGSGDVLVVGPGGDHATISAALAAAEDGDTIRILPGRYAEDLVITKSVLLEGDGPAEQVVLEAITDTRIDPETGEETEFLRGPELRDTNAVVRGLTVDGLGLANGSYLDAGIVITGGSPTLESVRIPRDDGNSSYDASVLLRSGSDATIRDSSFGGAIVAVGGSPSIIDTDVDAIYIGCPLAAGTDAVYVCAPGERALVQDNRLHGIRIDTGASPVIERNSIEGPSVDWAMPIPNSGILIWGGASGSGMAPMIVNNSLSGQDVGIEVFGDADRSLIEANDLSGNQTGVLIDGGDPTLNSNSISESVTGLVLEGSARPVLNGNAIESNVLGMSIARFAEPEMVGNVFCENVTNIKAPGREPPDLSDNEVCTDGSAS